MASLYEFSQRVRRGLRAVGFGVASTSNDMDVDVPTIKSGNGAPTATAESSSLYMRRSDGTLYQRRGGSWVLVSGGGSDFGSGGVKADVVAESTAAAGVTVDGLLVKDGSARPGAIADPGNAGAISVAASGVLPLVSAGAETRTLAIPTFHGQRIAIVLNTDLGTVTITVAQAIDEEGSTTIALDDAGDWIELVAVTIAGALRWRIAENCGCIVNLANRLTDPGNAGAIPVTRLDLAVCPLTSAGAETRTLAAPLKLGQRLALVCDVYVGDIVVTASAAVNVANNNTLTFGAVSEFIELLAVVVGGVLVWQVVANDGVGLTTV